MSEKCPECGAKIADNAAVCDKCGAKDAEFPYLPDPPAKKVWNKKAIIIGSIAAGLIAAAVIAALVFWFLPNASAKNALIKFESAYYSGDFEEYLAHDYYTAFLIEDDDAELAEYEENADVDEVTDFSIRVTKVSLLSSSDKEFIKNDFEEQGYDDVDKITDIRLVTYIETYKRGGEDRTDHGSALAIKIGGEWYFIEY